VALKGDLILAFDLGTSAVKVGLFSMAGDLLAVASREHTVRFPRRGHAEQSPTDTWRLSAEASRQVLRGAQVERVAAVVSAHHRGSVVPIGTDGTPLTDLIVWMDQRGLPQLARVRRLVGDNAYYDTSGHPIVSATGVCKALWLQEEAQQVWKRTLAVGSPQTLFLRWLGCDDNVIDHSSGSYHFPCDIRQRKWSDELAAALGFPIGRLPTLVPATAIVGKLGHDAAEQIGLPEGVPIVAGGGDGQCAAVGAGVVVPGRVMVNIGTGTGVQVFLPRPRFDRARTLNCAAHVVSDAWEMEAHTQASGAVLRWFRDEFGGIGRTSQTPDGRDAYDVLIEEASAAPAGAEGLVFLPTFNGSAAPIIDAHAAGAIAGLRLSHRRHHVVRAVLEGISLEIRWLLDALVATGAVIDEVRLVGGGSRNPTWNEIHADILDHPVHTVVQPDAALVGAAICAAVGLGAFSDFRAACDAFVSVGQTILPDAANVPVYEESLRRFVHLAGLLGGTGFG
jgi:xylulokinase